MTENASTYHALLMAYAERHRAYHTLEHIRACVGHLDTVKSLTHNPHEIELALWFHDAVYRPFSSTNETDSAEMAVNFLKQNGVPNEVIARVDNLVRITQDHIDPVTMDEGFMLDIDLSILATERSTYAQFEKDVRREYKLVPTLLFNKRRKDILRRFLERARLYHTDYFFERFENRAKANLEWAISQL